MRTDQYIGLPKDALDFLAKYRVPLEICPHCHRPTPNTKVIGRVDGCFGTIYELHEYELASGYAIEFLQASPWSSGPCFFIGLRAHNGVLERTFTWSDAEIEERL
jgi:hypothetical protein